ncbi:MAG: hypothetical protein SFY92_08445 [Verrucomicrobiae bacterium]|nr:hypothetical protein [Verrucomicrobiae bacterium]
MQSISEFKKIDLGRLVAGDILAERYDLEDAEKGLAVQSCFVIKRPSAEVARLIATWDPSKHKEMSIYQLSIFSRDQPGQFEKLDFTSQEGPVQKFVEETLRARDGKTGLLMSEEDLKSLQDFLSKELPAGQKAQSPEARIAAAKFWSQLTKTRFDQFVVGGLESLPTYKTKTATMSIPGEIREMISSNPDLYKRFQNLLHASVLVGKGGKPATAETYYWQLFKADKLAALAVGGVNIEKKSDRFQVIDYQFYVSHSYFTNITLYELWPVTVEGREYTLVWRTDLVSAPLFAWLKGVQQMAAGMLMTSSIREAIHFMKSDAESTTPGGTP